MKSKFFVFCVLALFFGGALCTIYKADIKITDDVNMPNAEIKASIYYQNQGGVVTLYYNYTPSGIKQEEFIHYSDGKRYLYCTSCQAQTYKVDKLILERLSTDTNTGTTANGCTKYTRASGKVKEIWVNNNNAICKIVLQDKTYTYSNYKTISATSSEPYYFSANKSWGCPKPVCTKKLDVVLVLDDSGSIDGYYNQPGSQWRQMIDFAHNVVDNFGSSETRFGVAFFHDDADIASYFDTNKVNIKNILAGRNREEGWTCMGCGLEKAAKIFNNGGPTTASRIVIFLSDGYNNRPYGTYNKKLTDSLAVMRSLGVTIVAIGVGSVKESEMLKIASRSDLYFYVDSFTALNGIMDSLVKETCSAVPDTYKDCPNCNGFCKCGTCVCPTCDPSKKNACQSDVCTTATTGCVIKKVVCPDNKCFTHKCDPARGCVVDKTTKCDGTCYDNRCYNSTGCSTVPIDSRCPKQACKDVVCTAAGKCQYTDRICKKINCKVERCDPTTDECVYEDYVCPKINECKTNTCNPTTGKCVAEDVVCKKNNCENVTCDNNLGCVRNPYNCPAPSNLCDKSVCDSTTDDCITTTTPGCSACAKVNCTKQMEEEGKLNKCNYAKCEEENGIAVCSVVEVTCANECYDTKCDLNSGGCVPNMTTFKCKAPSDPCKEAQCLDDRCAEKDKDCSIHSRCYVGYCKEGVGCAIDIAHLDDEDAKNPCKVYVCDEETGEYSFVYKDSCRNIDNTDDPCRKVKCDEALGECLEENICSNKCTEGPDPCKGSDPCMDYKCIPNEFDGTYTCEETPRCTGYYPCKYEECTTDGTCVNRTEDCSGYFEEMDGEVGGEPIDYSCFYAECVEEMGRCIKLPISSKFVDLCGSCVKDYGADGDGEKSGTSCLGKLTVPEAAAALTGAAVAGIIIACIVAAAIVATLGYFGTKELIRRAMMAQDQSANNNPLYEGNDNEMSNPAYNGAE